MIRLDCVRLNRWWGRLVPDRPPRTEVEFETLNMVLRGVDALLAGRDPDAEFTERVLGHPAVAEARLRYAPVGSKSQ